MSVIKNTKRSGAVMYYHRYLIKSFRLCEVPLLILEQWGRAHIQHEGDRSVDRKSFISFCLNFCPDSHISLHVLDIISFDVGELMTLTHQVWSFTFTQPRLAAAVKFTALKLDYSWNTHSHSHTLGWIWGGLLFYWLRLLYIFFETVIQSFWRLTREGGSADGKRYMQSLPNAEPTSAVTERCWCAEGGGNWQGFGFTLTCCKIMNMTLRQKQSFLRVLFLFARVTGLNYISGKHFGCRCMGFAKLSTWVCGIG